MTTSHYEISWSLGWRHISWISTFISIYTHDFIRQMQGLKIFKGSIITSAITTRAGSNTPSSPPAFLGNYCLQTDFHGMQMVWRIYYYHIPTVMILFILHNLHNIAFMKPKLKLLSKQQRSLLLNAKMQARQLIAKYIILDILLDFLDLLPVEVRLGGHPPALLSLHLLNNSCHNTMFRFRFPS